MSDVRDLFPGAIRFKCPDCQGNFDAPHDVCVVRDLRVRIERLEYLLTHREAETR